MFKSKYRYLFVLGLAIYSYLNVQFTVGDRLFDFDLSQGLLLLSIGTTTLLLWEGNRLIERLLAKKILKINTLIVHFLISVIWLIVTSLGILAALYFLVGEPVLFNWDNYKLLVAFAFRINLFLNTVNAISFYANKSKQVELENQIQERLLIESQHQNLKNQLNPHFLFNSLNVLASLVSIDAERSERFIEQLSKVYRYLLQHQEKELTELSNELNFLDAYIYLLKTRFDEAVNINIEVPAEAHQKLIAPGTLQLLFENAIKHNVITKKQPLNISVKLRKERLYISNSLQLKTETKNSTKIGLKNLIHRYELLVGQPIIVDQSALGFEVSIPLI